MPLLSSRAGAPVSRLPVGVNCPARPDTGAPLITGDWMGEGISLTLIAFIPAAHRVEEIDATFGRDPEQHHVRRSQQPEIHSALRDGGEAFAEMGDVAVDVLYDLPARERGRNH